MLLALFVTYSFCIAKFWSVDSDTSLLFVGLQSGWARMLSFRPPLPLRTDLVMVPIASVMVSAWAMAETIWRTRAQMLVWLPPIALTACCALLGTADALRVSPSWLVALACLLALSGIRVHQLDSGGNKALRDLVSAAGIPIGSIAPRLVAVGAVAVVAAIPLGRLFPERQSVQARQFFDIDSDATRVVDPLSYMSDEKSEEGPAFSVSLTEVPSTTRFRLMVLDQYDGRTWTATTKAAPTGGRVSREAAVENLVEQRVRPLTELPALPVLGNVVDVSGPAVERGDVLADSETGMVLAHPGSTLGEVVLRSSVVSADPASLTNARFDGSVSGAGASGRLTTSLPQSLDDARAKVFEGAKSPFQQISRLVQFFANAGEINSGEKFVYDKGATTGHTMAHLALFMADEPDSRRGTEEQFVSAAASIARANGIPARIAVGYRPAEPMKSNRQQTIARSSLTAWLEVAFVGYGWVAFDPLPTEGTKLPPPTPEEIELTRTMDSAVQDSKDGKPPQPPKEVVSPPEPPVQPDQTWTRILQGSIVAAVLALLILVSPVALKWLRRRRRRTTGRPADRVAGAWAEITDRVVERNVTLRESFTFAEVVNAAEDSLNGPTQSLHTIASHVSGSLFGPGDPTDADADAVWTEVDEFLKELSASENAYDRARARLSPRPLVGSTKYNN